MQKNNEIALAFQIDKLTNSIENSISGEVFETTVSLLNLKECKQLTKKDWLFDWKLECEIAENQVYKLTTTTSPTIIQGLLSLTDKGDHIFMNLIENAKFNKGKQKLYLGVERVVWWLLLVSCRLKKVMTVLFRLLLRLSWSVIMNKR